MHRIVKSALLGIILVASAIGCLGRAASGDVHGSLVVVMKDGRRQTIPVAEITKIEFKDADIVVFTGGGQKSFRLSETQSFEFDTSASTAFAPSRRHFVANGEWAKVRGLEISTSLWKVMARRTNPSTPTMEPGRWWTVGPASRGTTAGMTSFARLVRNTRKSRSSRASLSPKNPTMSRLP